MSQPATPQQLADAISTGELLFVIYHGGHAPGAKRRIQPRKIVTNLVYARDATDGRVKTFYLDKLELCTEDDPAPWAEDVTKRQIGLKIAPDAYFAGWAYEMTKHFNIPDSRHFWSALGVSQREYVDQDKTALAKRAATERGEPKQDIDRIKIRHLAWAVAPLPNFDFHEGDLFYSTRGDAPIQVVAIRDLIEVHRILVTVSPPRQAFQIIETELADWLRNGEMPSHARIGPDLSYSDTLRFSIAYPNRSSTENE